MHGDILTHLPVCLAYGLKERNSRFFIHICKNFRVNSIVNSISLFTATVISVLEKLLSQSTEQDNPGRLVIEAAHGSAAKVRELVQKHPDKVDAVVFLH